MSLLINSEPTTLSSAPATETVEAPSRHAYKQLLEKTLATKGGCDSEKYAWVNDETLDITRMPASVINGFILELEAQGKNARFCTTTTLCISDK